MFQLRQLLVTALLGAATAGFCQNDQPVIAPSLDPSSLLNRMVEQGAFGSMTVTEKIDAPVQLEISGDFAVQTGNLVLVEPGLPVTLTASLDQSAVPSSESERDQGYFQTLAIERSLWEGNTSDEFSQSGNSVVWRSGTSQGKASYLSISLARLEANLPVLNLEEKGQGRLLSGKLGLMLLSGVAYDRNGDGMIFGHNVGIYPDEAAQSSPNTVRDNAENYRPPLTFYRLDASSRNAVVAPPMTLGQLNPPVFAGEDGDRYVPVSPRLMTFLNAFFEKLREANLDPARVQVLRGFVSPTERLRLSRQEIRLAEFTRYQYGDAVALIYGKAPASEASGPVPPQLADVNGDGNADIADIEWMAAKAKEVMDELGMYGGLGVSGSFGGPGAGKGLPFLHVDLRGFYVAFRED